MKDWKDIYELPISDSYIDGDDGFRSGRISDNKSQFIFQFLNVGNKTQETTLAVINGEKNLTNTDIKFSHKDGYILANDRKVIMIRGWGNLTGGGGHNLKQDVAANVQDTFADYIVNQLNERL